MTLKIRNIQYHDVASAALLPPAEWGFNFTSFWYLHTGKRYFRCLVVTDGQKSVGVGCAILNDDTAWLGTIVVHPEFRGIGVGKIITRQLIQVAEEHACASIVLIATPSGEKLYTSLGFEKSHAYTFYRGKSLSPITEKAIRPLVSTDMPHLLEIDRLATGEKRHVLLRRFMEGCLVFDDGGTIRGYYLPNLGDGFIAARDSEAGLRLTRHRLATRETIVVPEGNHAAHQFLKANGFDPYLTAPRMFLKQEVAFTPEMVYSRGAGYFG